MDNSGNTVRTATQSISLTSNTIFTSATDLLLYPFTTSVKFEAPTVTEYSLSAQFLSSNVVITLTGQPKCQMEWFQGMVLVVNPSAMTISGTQNMTHTANSFSIL